MHFLLSQREKNTEILCSECKHLINGECDRLVRIDGLFFRLARLSVSGGECQLFKQKTKPMKCWYIYGEVCIHPPGICDGCQKYEDWRKQREAKE